jgi:hypothetical protein
LILTTFVVLGVAVVVKVVMEVEVVAAVVEVLVVLLVKVLVVLRLKKVVVLLLEVVVVFLVEVDMLVAVVELVDAILSARVSPDNRDVGSISSAIAVASSGLLLIAAPVDPDFEFASIFETNSSSYKINLTYTQISYKKKIFQQE